MPTKVKPIPDGHRTVAPYLAIKNAAGALDFYKTASPTNSLSLAGRRPNLSGGRR
jgi:PhnB protein